MTLMPSALPRGPGDTRGKAEAFMSGSLPARRRASQPFRGTRSARRPNTLGLRRKELEDLFAEIEAAAVAAGGAGTLGATSRTAQPAPGGGPGRREFIRRAFQHTTVPMQIFNRNGAVSGTIAVACRNLSRGGIAVLHSAYIHIGTRVLLALPHPSGVHYVAVRGEVVRCQHFRGVVHDIGIRFEELINVRDMLGLDPFGDWFSLEQVDAGRLSGSLLLVSPSPEDIEALRLPLRNTAIAVTDAAGGEAALQMVNDKPFDVILCDHALPDMSGTDFVTRLRAAGATTPVIMTTDEASEENRMRIAACPADAFLLRPVEADLLLRAVAEFLPNGEAEAAEAKAAQD